MLTGLLVRFGHLSVRNVSTSPALGASVFTKKAKKMDPEVAKARETRRRRKLTREIRQMLKHSKKPKPVTELSIDVKAARNLDERIRDAPELSATQISERVSITKQFNTSRNKLAREEFRWLKNCVHDQDRAMQLLKTLSPSLHAAASQLPEDTIVYQGVGPSLTPPLKDYKSPDGDYEDTTKTWE